MSKFLVATEVDGMGRRYVRTAIGHIKTAIKAHLDTKWKVESYDFKFDLANVCQAVEDIRTVATAAPRTFLRVTPSGQCREAGED